MKEGRYCSNWDCKYMDEARTKYEEDHNFKRGEKTGRTLLSTEPIEEFAKRFGITGFDAKDIGNLKGKCAKCKTHDMKFTEWGVFKTDDGHAYAFLKGECICGNKYSKNAPCNDAAKNWWRGII